MKSLIIIIAVCFASIAGFGQTKPKAVSAKNAAAQKADSVKKYVIVFTETDINGLLNLIDQSQAPHSTVKAYIDYIQKNARLLTDSTGKK